MQNIPHSQPAPSPLSKASKAACSLPQAGLDSPQAVGAAVVAALRPVEAVVALVALALALALAAAVPGFGMLQKRLDVELRALLRQCQ